MRFTRLALLILLSPPVQVGWTNLPPLPGVSSFLEVNVRTYVRAADGKPGIWFFSLDASSRLAVEAARHMYKLPYFQARISMHHRGEVIEYESRRAGDDRRRFSGRYSPEGASFHADRESLEWFLVERYCHYGTDELGRLLRADIHHEPWLLQRAEATIEATSLAPIELQGNAGSDTESAPSSSNHLYGNGSSDSDGRFETVLDVGCQRNAANVLGTYSMRVPRRRSHSS